jgi:hypothetical protein
MPDASSAGVSIAASPLPPGIFFALQLQLQLQTT